MQDSKVRVGLRIKIKRLNEKNLAGMCIHTEHLSVRRRGVVGTVVLQMASGVSGDIWLVQHDNSPHVGAYVTSEIEELPLWHEEISQMGLRAGILDRLKFHGGLYIKYVAENTGFSARTIMKHAEHLVQNGLAVWSRQPSDMGDWILSVPKT